MSRSPKPILLVLGGIAGLLVLVALASPLWLDVNRYKPRLEAAASDALGMDVRIAGRLRLGFVPGLDLTLEDGQILGERGEVVASAKRVRLWVQLLPLLRKELRLRGIDLIQPSLSVERDTEGRLNIERLKKVVALLATLDGARVSLTDGTIRYADRRSGTAFEATGCGVAAKGVRLAGASRPQLLKSLSVEAELVCREFRAKDLTVSTLKASLRVKDGVFELQPVSMLVFRGSAAASLRVDASGPIPLCQIQYSLPGFRIEEFLRTLSPKPAARGAMDFSATLTMQGETGGQWVRTAAGRLSLRGRNLILVGTDFDRETARYESSQHFSLVDLGAVFLAGPMGLAVTKGYNFAGLFQCPGGQTNIVTLVSEWTVERGVARAKDVAMATPRNRIALQGGLDFVDERFADLTMAVVDAEGCASLRQAIKGPFVNPTVEKPRALSSLSGPIVNLYRRTRGMFPAGPCNPFYTGSVPAPR